jgi:signal transduction histidine kinase
MEADRRRMDTQYEEMLRLNREMGWKLKQIGLMQQCSRAVLAVLDEGALLDKIAEFLETTCQVQHFALFRVNEDRTELRGLKGRAFLAWDREQIAHLRMALGDSSVLCRAVRSGVGETEGHLGGATGDEPGWVHAVPLIARGEVAGVLAVWGRETGRRQADILEMLHLFAPLLAVTLENAMIHSQMRTQLQQLKESRSLLCRADKLSAMGSLASQLAHEIKNPLTAIETFFQLLPERWSDSDFRTRFFDIAKNESMRIRRLLKQFLNLAAQGEEVVGTANLHAVIEYLLVILEPHASQRQVRLELQAQARRTEFRMVADKLQQAFMNILMNALSAAPAGSAVVVATSDAVSGGVRPAVRIDILDSGPGIPAEWRQRIFEPFFSRQPPKEKNEGTGLGLFIAKQNIADHGGEIEVLDREGGGTLFRVLIPVERRQG